MPQALSVPPARQIARRLAQVDESFFAQTPVKLDGFTLRARSAVPNGKPSLSQWEAAYAFATAAEEASPYWIGDLLIYAESRKDWNEKIDQVVSRTGLAKHTIENRAYVSRHVAEPERCISPSLAHSTEVASLDRVEQTKFLEAAQSHGWTVRELRSNVRASKRMKVLEGRADGWHTVEVSVLVDVEGQNEVLAEETAWDIVKRAIQGLKGAKVIAAHSRKK